MTLHALGCMYLGGMAAWTAVTTGLAWRRGGQLLLRFALVSPSWPLLVILAFTDNRKPRQLSTPAAPDPLAPYMLEAMREVDAITPQVPRLAPPSGPTASAFLGTLNARVLALRDESARRVLQGRSVPECQVIRNMRGDVIRVWNEQCQQYDQIPAEQYLPSLTHLQANLGLQQAQHALNARQALQLAQGASNAYLQAQQANSQEWTRRRELMQRYDEARRRAAIAQLKSCEREDREQSAQQADLWDRLWRKQQEMRRQLETKPDEDVI